MTSGTDLGGPISSLQAIDAILAALYVAMLVCALVVAAVLASKAFEALQRRLDPRVLPALTRRTRARHGLPPDADRWACRRCHSINAATALRCYRCRAPALEAAAPLPERRPDELWHGPEPRNRFDPSRYRGPGSPGGTSASMDCAPEAEAPAAAPPGAPSVDAPSRAGPGDGTRGE